MWFRLQHWLLHHGGRWQSVLIVLFLQCAALLAMLRIGTAFRATTGYEPFDFQSELTNANIEQQLPAYSPEAVRLYDWIAVFDFAFPLLGGLLWTLVLVAGLRLGWPALLQGMRGRYWLLLPFIGTICDWAENVFNLTAIHSYPPLAPVIAALIVAAKQAKMLAVSATGFSVVAIFLIGLTLHWNRRRRRL